LKNFNRRYGMLRKISISNVALHPLIKALPDDTLGDIHSKLGQHNSVVVVDTTGHFKGIICRKDMVRKMLSEPDWKRIPVTEVMITKVLYVPNHVSLAVAAKDMLDADIHQLVVTGPPEGGSVPIGILTLGEVVRNAI
jgi:signal-transduction protein with cAMP-binding, CBS, and nucleotidyltransferase domain